MFKYSKNQQAFFKFKKKSLVKGGFPPLTSELGGQYFDTPLKNS